MVVVEEEEEESKLLIHLANLWMVKHRMVEDGFAELDRVRTKFEMTSRICQNHHLEYHH